MLRIMSYFALGRMPHIKTMGNCLSPLLLEHMGTRCPRRDVSSPVLNSGLSQLLKLVQAELKAQEQKEQEAPIPDQTSAEDAFEEVMRPPHAERYAVAAKTGTESWSMHRS